MITNKGAAGTRTAGWLAAVFAGVQLVCLVLRGPLATWDAQVQDRFMALRTALHLPSPPYDGSIVHVDLNNASLQALDHPYIDRTHHARLNDNLAAMQAAAILYDFVMPGASEPRQDRRLVDAVRSAGNVYLGMVLRLAPPARGTPPRDPGGARGLEREVWRLTASAAAGGYFRGLDPITNLPELAAASRGAGFLTLRPDPDGVFRRLPLLVRFADGFFPSFALRVVCDFLKVFPQSVALEPGKIILRDAVRPDRPQPFDLAIPVDAGGSLRINFLGPWGAMTHYNFADIYRASDDRDLLEVWRQELAGRIVLVSDVSTGSADVGQVPTDPEFPLSGVHANAINTLLGGAFLREAPPWAGLLLEGLLLLVVMALFLRRSAPAFTLGNLAVAGGYLLAAGAALTHGNLLLPVVKPLVLLLTAVIGLLIRGAVENARAQAAAEKAREVAERELEIGRQIQAGFLPAAIPSPAGWEIAAYFQPARQVAGDFYDVFALDGGRWVALAVADVCDKGVGAALFMALTRSLVRALTLQGWEDWKTSGGPGDPVPEEVLLRTVRQTNHYMATTHGDAHMFATVWLGLLEPHTGSLTYVNCGHEPPLVLAGGEVRARLKATGPAVGAMDEAPFRADACRLEPGELLLAYTDGVTDAVNGAGELYSRQRLIDLLTRSPGLSTASACLGQVADDLAAHVAGSPPVDDITLLAVRRAEMSADAT